jgi:hypothetical protein
MEQLVVTRHDGVLNRMLVKKVLLVLGAFIIALPYVGPSFFGLGLKPLWIFLVIIPIFVWGKARWSIIFFISLFLLMEATRYFLWPLSSFYAVYLWGLLFLFIFSSGLIEKLNFTNRQLAAFQKIFYGLFFFLYMVDYLNPAMNNLIVEFFVGQSRNLNRSDFSFLSPEPGLGAFSILTVAFAIFHLTNGKNYWQMVIPCVLLCMIGSATSYGLALLWLIFYLTDILVKSSRTFTGVTLRALLVILSVGVVMFVMSKLVSSHALSRFDALWNFDIESASSVSHRARDLLRLLDFGMISDSAAGPVGIVKAAVHAPAFTIALIVFILFYCNFSSALLIFPALIFLPLTHPFIWLVLSFSRLKRVRG